MARLQPSAGLVVDRSAGRLVARAGEWLLVTFAAERARWPLWMPVLFGIGIAIYFVQPVEPAPWIAAMAFAVASVIAIACRRHQGPLLVGWALLLVVAGFGAAQLRAHLVAAPVIEKRTPPVTVEGRVRLDERRAEGRRLTLDRLSIGRLDHGRVPETVRITVRQSAPPFRPGETVRLRAVLYPPPAPAAPGAFDFARRAWFERLGGVGYAVSRPERTGEAAEGFAIGLERLRQRLTERIRSVLPGAIGGMAAALMTGDRGGISEDVLSAMRDSGLAHLLAISGLHIGLVGGLLFFAMRFLMAVAERPALRWPAKKWAAAAALVGAFAYLLISGSTVPTQRAFLMLALVLLAVAIDRQPISMNLVAWAAGAILLVAPESLLSVSFQMSFAAVIALIAVYEAGAARLAGRRRDGPWPRPLVYLGTVAISTLVAGLATAPFAAYHFNRVALYSLLANLLAVPLTALWIMPCAVVAFLLMPLGLEAWPLAAMGWGIDALIGIARWIQALPGSASLVPAMPTAGFALIVAGGLWLCLWQRVWRFAGAAPIAAGLATLAFVQTPDLLVDGEGRAFAARGPDGRLVVINAKGGMTAETWLRRAAQEAPSDRADTLAWLRCDALGCIYRIGGQTVALVKSNAALAEDCARAGVVIASIPVRRGICRGPPVVIDRWRLWRDGPHALWFSPDGVRVESVGADRGDRPWSPRRDWRAADAQ